MIKGTLFLKQFKSKKWVTIFRTWINSGNAVVVIHCNDPQQIRNVRSSASMFRAKENADFWIKTVGNDLYLIRPDPIKDIALEVKQDPNGVIYFYDSTKTL